MFLIKITYSSICEFSIDQYEDYEIILLSYKWKNMKVVRENVKRIQAHFVWYKNKTDLNFNECKKPKFCKDKNTVVLLTSDRKEFELDTSNWCGILDSLQEVEVIEEQEFEII